MSYLMPGLVTCLRGDSGRLRQVLINLLGNAVKFTDAGEVVLTVRNHESGRPGEVEFAVSDMGTGIAADKLETIFDRFTQADSSIARKYGGTGLGLEISHRLVESMGGELTATSHLGKGSNFRFNVPFELGTEVETAGAVRVTNLHGRRVLVIVDNATSRFILGQTLRSWGLKSTEFGDPFGGVACLAAETEASRPFSLVLVDSEMPGM
ncbi:MAG: hypothetical protein H7039_05045, partial [Bryobacteraceae bacterium]|nr:hypothetical protein [Bryobacteraceae bacterium]